MPTPRALGDTPRVIHGAVRGVVAAMAMTGMRTASVDAGLLSEEPPQAVLRERAQKLMRRVPRRRRRAVRELVHWGYGAAGGAAFAALPEKIRLKPWSGPVYGLVVWLGFESVVAPALRLRHSRERRLVERAALAVDHTLYGFVLSETRRRPQD